MAENPYVNKVELADGTTLIDISGDTVAADKMLSGYTAHDMSGAAITGSIENGTITNNYTGSGASSGTVNRGYKIKIGKGFYSSDRIYTAQANTGYKTITSSGQTSVDGCSYVIVNAGSISNNTTLPSGSTSSGTIARGYYIKIGKGFYNNDLYYAAQNNSGTKTITASGTTTVSGYSFASVAAGDITNNTTLPSGSTSSGTVNFGEYIKVGAGFYDSDTYYQAKDRQLSYDSETKHLTMTY